MKSTILILILLLMRKIDCKEEKNLFDESLTKIIIVGISLLIICIEIGIYLKSKVS